MPTLNPRFSAILVGLLGLLVLSPADGGAATLDRVIDAEGGARAAELVAPFGLGDELVDGVVLDQISSAARSITYVVRDGANREAELILTVGLDPSATRAFDVGLTTDVPPGGLAQAIEALRQAVANNDDGSFPFVELEGTLQEEQSGAARRVWIAWAAWLLLVAVLLGRLWQAQVLFTHRQRMAACAGVCISLAVTCAGALSSPFGPLHNNSHAYTDIAASLGLSGAGQALVNTYGPGLFSAHHALTSVVGGHHDGLAVAQLVLAGVLVILWLGVARALRFGWVASVLSVVFVAGSPLMVRLIRSESALLVAGVLMASVVLLWLWKPTRRVAPYSHIGLGIAAFLLVSGHPIGLGVCAATGLIALSYGLRHGLGLVPSSTRTVATLAGAGAGVWLLPLALEVTSERVPMGFAGSLPSVIMWLRPEFAPTALWPLAAVGLALVFGLPRPRTRDVAAGALLVVGMTALVLGVTHVVDVTDAIRYQSLLALVLFLLTAEALAYTVRSTRLARGVAVLLVTFAAAGLLWARVQPACVGLEAEAYLSLRQALTTPDEIWLIQMRRPDSQVIHEMPVGRWSSAGPTVHAMLATEASDLCHERGVLPDNTWIWMSPSFSVPGEEPARERLLAFADDAEGLAIGMMGANRPTRWGGLGEFHPFPDEVPWLVAPARCPPSTTP